jgi:hypothetical protein
MIEFSSSPSEKNNLMLKVNIRFKQIREDLIIAQCKEFPFIIVKGKDLNNLQDQIYNHLGIYLDTFPAKKKTILHSMGVNIKNTEDDNLHIDNSES